MTDRFAAMAVFDHCRPGYPCPSPIRPPRRSVDNRWQDAAKLPTMHRSAARSMQEASPIWAKLPWCGQQEAPAVHVHRDRDKSVGIGQRPHRISRRLDWWPRQHCTSRSGSVKIVGRAYRGTLPWRMVARHPARLHLKDVCGIAGKGGGRWNYPAVTGLDAARRLFWCRLSLWWPETDMMNGMA